MELRRLCREDLDRVANYAVEGMRPHLVPLHLSMDRVRAVIRHLEISEQDYHQVAEHDGQIVGAIAAVASPMLFFERWEASVVMLRATMPGAGAALVRGLMQWARDDIRIKRVVLTMEFDAPRSMARFLRMNGFGAPQGTAVAYT